MTKTCSTCGATKELIEFTPDRKFKDGFTAQCKKCRNARIAKNQRGDPSYREKQRLIAKEMRFGLGINTLYDELFKRQGGVCALCGKPETKVHKAHKCACDLSIDHDHRTGKIRGLLCHVCNTLLGRLEANIELLPKMLEYIKERG